MPASTISSFCWAVNFRYLRCSDNSILLGSSGHAGSRLGRPRRPFGAPRRPSDLGQLRVNAVVGSRPPTCRATRSIADRRSRARLACSALRLGSGCSPSTSGEPVSGSIEWADDFKSLWVILDPRDEDWWTGYDGYLELHAADSDSYFGEHRRGEPAFGLGVALPAGYGETIFAERLNWIATLRDLAIDPASDDVLRLYRTVYLAEALAAGVNTRGAGGLARPAYAGGAARSARRCARRTVDYAALSAVVDAVTTQATWMNPAVPRSHWHRQPGLIVRVAWTRER